MLDGATRSYGFGTWTSDANQVMMRASERREGKCVIGLALESGLVDGWAGDAGSGGPVHRTRLDLSMT